jgi:hypothetical protein
VHPAGHREEMCVTAYQSGSPNGEPSDHTSELQQTRIVYQGQSAYLAKHEAEFKPQYCQKKKKSITAYLIDLRTE